MIASKFSDIANEIGGKLVGKDATVDFVSTDSRRFNSQNKSNQVGLFVALKGPHFDAHDFVAEVAKNENIGFVVEHKCPTDRPQILVENTRIALANIARLNRNKSHAKYIAITGSSGKTTVKEMIASVLTLAGKTHATQGNLNNDIGVPLTLLEMDSEDQFGVVELGANHIGEVAFTADITRPNIALVNNVSAAHLQGFGDIQGVARAKGEIYSALADDGVAIINQDDPFCDFFTSLVDQKTIYFSAADSGSADVYPSCIEMQRDQSIRFNLHYKNESRLIELPLVGLHNVSNALAAASCCLAADIDLATIAKGLSRTPKVQGRLIVNNLCNGCRVIDDSYNANLASMKAAIDLLSNYPSPTILVLGDMAELGEQGRQCHEDVGAYAAQSGIEQMFSCGVLTQFSQLAFDHKNAIKDESQTHFSNQDELIIKLKKEAIDGVTLLVKGSRSAHMENVVKALIGLSKLTKSENSNDLELSVASLKGEK